MRQFGFCWIANTSGIGMEVWVIEKVVLRILPVIFFIYICQKEFEFQSMSEITCEEIKKHRAISIFFLYACDPDILRCIGMKIANNKRLSHDSFQLTLRLLMSYIYIYMERLFLMFLDHTQRRTTVGRTPLDE